MQIFILLLRAEMKTCSTQVAKLTREFDEFKKVVEAAQSEVDATCLIVIELTNRLKDICSRYSLTFFIEFYEKDDVN